MPLALLVLLLALLAPRALAGEEQRTTLGPVDITVRYAWPQAVHGGYFPIRVELVNTGADELEVDVEAVNLGETSRTHKRVRLAARERHAFDLLCVGHVNRSDATDIHCKVGGEEAVLGGMGPVDRGLSSRGSRHVILLVTPDVPEPGTRERWEQSLGQDEYHVGDVRFEHLSERFEAYSSLDTVVLDVSRGLPPTAALEAILRWTRLGGTLVLFGENAREVAHDSDALRPWLEERFSVTRTDDEHEAWSYGLGRLVGIGSTQLLEGPERAFLDEQIALGSRQPGWVPRSVDTSARRHAPVVEAMNPLPLRTLAAMLVLFALLIGPVNFIAVKRLGRSSLLLVTVPVIALVASLGLLAYGVLHQGLAVKAVTKSYTLLDERMRRASTIELRNLFAGGSPGPGLRPDEGSTCFLNTLGYDEDQQVAIDLTGGTLLAADFLPVRQPVAHVLHSDGAARARLEVARADDGLVVTNGLGARVEELLVRSPEGVMYRLVQPLDDGGRASLLPFAEASDPDFLASSIARCSVILGTPHDVMPPGTYLATLADSPFVDDCGLDVRVIAGEHFVLGVLALDAEGWR